MLRLQLNNLRRTITSFSASVTETRHRSSLSGPQRALRPVRFNARSRVTSEGAAALGAFDSDDWIWYRDVVRYHAQPSLNTAWEREEGEFTDDA